MSSRRRPGSTLFLPLCLLAFLMGVAVLTTRSSYTVTDLLLLGLLYASLAVALSSFSHLLARRGVWLELVGALFIGGVAAWHMREQLRPAGVGPTLWTVAGMAPFLGFVLVAAAGQALLRRLAAAPRPEARHGTVLLASSAVFVAILLGSYSNSETFRWHLLRHNKLIGTPAFHLLSTRVDEIEERDWTSHAAGTVVQPDWVHEISHEPRAPSLASDPTLRRVQPDVVFVLIDTLRADVLEAYGGDPSWMPTLNRLARKGFVFTDLLANSSWTRPSVGSFFTGLAPEEHGAAGWYYPISPGVVTMAEVFKRRGYDTAAFVANYDAVNVEGSFDRGFDRFDAVEDPASAYARADFVTDRVSGWIDDRGTPDEAPPLFLYVHYLDPHVPYLSSGPERSTVTSHDDARAFYGDEVRFLDVQLERLIGRLDTRLRRPRVTLVTSDHGEEFGEHDARGHGQTLYSEVLHIPAVLVVEGASRAVSHTIVDSPLEGRDFFDMLLRTAEDSERDVPRLAESLGRTTRVASVSEWKSPGSNASIHYLLRPYRHHIYARMVQRDGWRLIWSAYGPTRELYDLADDPGERENRLSTRRELVSSLHDELDSTPPHWRRPGTIGISEESLERLRGLGYIR